MLDYVVRRYADVFMSVYSSEGLYIIRIVSHHPWDISVGGICRAPVPRVKQ